MADGKLTVKITSPEGVCFEGDVLHASFPGTVGEFAVFPAHAPLISSLKNGIIKFTEAEGETRQTIRIKGGFVEVANDIITVGVEIEKEPEAGKAEGRETSER